MKIKTGSATQEPCSFYQPKEGEETEFITSIFIFSKDQFMNNYDQWYVNDPEDSSKMSSKACIDSIQAFEASDSQTLKAGPQGNSLELEMKEKLEEETTENFGTEGKDCDEKMGKDCDEKMGKETESNEVESEEDGENEEQDEIEINQKNAEILEISKPFKPNYTQRVSTWLTFSKYGRPIEKIFAIPSKTFLEKYRWRPYLKSKNSENYSLIQCLREHREKGINITKIIDLSNSKIYYDFGVLIKKYRKELQNVEYRKIEIDPSGLPRKKDLNKVNDILGKNLYQKGEKKTYVLIHCTHGVNRTGYVIMYFLHVRLGIPLDEARHIFEEARGHKIDSEVLMKDLYERVKI